MRKSRTLDSRDMSSSRKLFVKLRNRRTLPKDFSQRSLLLLWLSRVWFNKLNIAHGGDQPNSLVFSLLHDCYESFKQDNAVNSRLSQSMLSFVNTKRTWAVTQSTLNCGR